MGTMDVRVMLLLRGALILYVLSFAGCGRKPSTPTQSPVESAEASFTQYREALKQQEWKTAAEMLSPKLQDLWLMDLELSSMFFEDIERKKSPDLLYLFNKHGIEDFVANQNVVPKEKTQYLHDLASFHGEQNKKYGNDSSRDIHLFANSAGHMDFEESTDETKVKAVWIEPVEKGTELKIDDKVVTEVKLYLEFVNSESGWIIKLDQKRNARPPSNQK